MYLFNFFIYFCIVIFFLNSSISFSAHQSSSKKNIGHITSQKKSPKKKLIVKKKILKKKSIAHKSKTRITQQAKKQLKKPPNRGRFRALTQAKKKKLLANHSHQYSITQSNLPNYLQTHGEKNLVNYIESNINTLRYNSYRFGGTQIDTERGIYSLDCSSYVDHVLKFIYPDAFSSLVSWAGSNKPTTFDFYHYFNNLTQNKKSSWQIITTVEALRPGDVLVFRYKNTKKVRKGHVMFVMDKPQRKAKSFFVRVADAAPYRHSKDTRRPHTSGIGIGTLSLKIDPKTFKPYAYAWSQGAPWRLSKVAMARPLLTKDTHG